MVRGDLHKGDIRADIWWQLCYRSVAGPFILHDSPQFTFLAGRDYAGSSLQCPDSLVSPQQLSCSSTCGILVPQAGIKPVSPALEGSFLPTRPPGKSLPVHFLSHFPWRLFWVSFTLFKLQTHPYLSDKLASWFSEKLPTPWHHKPHPWLHASSLPFLLSFPWCLIFLLSIGL